MTIILDNKSYLFKEEECQISIDSITLTLTDDFINESKHNCNCAVYLYKQRRFKNNANFLLQVIHKEHIIDFNGCNIQNIDDNIHNAVITISYKTVMVREQSQQIPLKEIIQSLQQQLI